MSASSEAASKTTKKSLRQKSSAILIPPTGPRQDTSHLASSPGTPTSSYLSRSRGTPIRDGLSPEKRQQEEDYRKLYPSLKAFSQTLQQAIEDNFFLAVKTDTTISPAVSITDDADAIVLDKEAFPVVPPTANAAEDAILLQIVNINNDLAALLRTVQDASTTRGERFESFKSILMKLRELNNLSRQGLLPLGRIDLFLRLLSDTFQVYDAVKQAEKETQKALKKQALQELLALKERKELEWRQAQREQEAQEASGGLEAQKVPQSSKVQELWEELQALGTQLGVEKERLEADFSRKPIKSKAEDFLQLRLAKLLPRLRQLETLLTRAQTLPFAERLKSFLLDDQAVTLDLSHCQLTDADLKALAYVVLCKPLSRLELADNPALTPKGINAFIKKLTQAANPCLTYLNISNIAMNQRNILSLARTLRASLRYTHVFTLDVSTDLRESITDALNSPRSLPLSTRFAAGSQSRELSPFAAASPLRESSLPEGETVFTVVDDYARMQICKQEMLPFVTLVNHLKQALTEAPILCRSTEHAPIAICVSAFTHREQRTHDIHSLQALCDVLDSYCQSPSEESIHAILSLLRQLASTKVERLDDEDSYIQLFYRYVHVTFNCYDALGRTNPAIDARSSPAILSTLHDRRSPSISHGTASSSTGPNLTFFSAPLPYVASDLTSRALVSDAANVFLQTRLAELIPTLRQFMSITTKLATLDKSSQLNPWLAFMTRRPLTLLKPLTLLNLNFCDLDDDDIKAISYAMLGSDLQVLDLSNNPRVTGAAVSALCLALKHDPEPKLQQLLLPEIALTEEQLTPLVETLSRETCQVHTVLMGGKNGSAFWDIWNRVVSPDVAASCQVFAYKSMLLLDFPAKRLEAQRNEMSHGARSLDATRTDTPRRGDSPSSASSSTSPVESSGSPLLRSVTTLYEGIKVLICTSFFDVMPGGGKPVSVEGKTYTAPTTIAGIHYKLEELLKGETPISDDAIKNRLSLIDTFISGRSRGWFPDSMSTLCYQMLRDTFLLNDAMRRVESGPNSQRRIVSDETFLCSRLESLVSTLQTIKTLIQRLRKTDSMTADSLEEAFKGEVIDKLDLTRAKLSLQEIDAIFYLLPSVTIRRIMLDCAQPITDITMLIKTLPRMNKMNMLFLGHTQLSEDSKIALYAAAMHATCQVTRVIAEDPDKPFLIRLAYAAEMRKESREQARISRTESLGNVSLHAHRRAPSSSSSMPNLVRHSTSSRTPDM